MCYNLVGDKMIENMNNMLEKARLGKYAVGHFNINNLEWTRYILETCQEMNSPVIIGVSEGAAKYMGGYLTTATMVRSLVMDLNITIPVAIHLDHGTSLESCKKAIDAGFTSVMIDASKLELSENIKVTKEVIEFAKKYNVAVETEVGAIGGDEDGVANELAYAKIEDAVKMVEETNVDVLTPALGSVHGLYKGEPKLDFVRMSKISELVKKPLVLHGGSGIPDNLIKEAIKNGICKINMNTELQIVWAQAVREFLNENQEVYDPRKVIKSGEKVIKELLKEKILLFGSDGKA